MVEKTLNPFSIGGNSILVISMLQLRAFEFLVKNKKKSRHNVFCSFAKYIALTNLLKFMAINKNKMKLYSLIGKFSLSFAALVTSFSIYAQVVDTNFVIGVVPNVSARIIANNYQPLAEYLQNGLGVPVAIVTAKDFPTFHQRALAKDFQLMITTPNLGRVAVKDGAWEVLYVFEPNIPGLLVGLKDQDNDLTKVQYCVLRIFDILFFHLL
jgi:hypothetical protein